MFQWNRECVFLRHLELNSRFIVTTIDDVTLNRPELDTGFSVICCICRLRLSWFALKFSTDIFAPYGLLPPWSGFSEFVVSSWQFCCTICNPEYEFISFLWHQYFFRVDASSISFWWVQPFQFFRSAIRISPFQILPAINSYPRKNQIILACQFDEVLTDLALKSDDIQSVGWDRSEFPWSSSLRSSLLESCSCLRADSRNSWSLPNNFAVPSAIGRIKMLSLFCGVNASFALSLRTWISDASIFSNSSNAYPRNFPGRTFFPNWWSLDWSRAEIG